MNNTLVDNVEKKAVRYKMLSSAVEIAADEKIIFFGETGSGESFEFFIVAIAKSVKIRPQMAFGQNEGGIAATLYYGHSFLHPAKIPVTTGYKTINPDGAHWFFRAKISCADEINLCFRDDNCFFNGNPFDQFFSLLELDHE